MRGRIPPLQCESPTVTKYIVTNSIFFSPFATVMKWKCSTIMCSRAQCFQISRQCECIVKSINYLQKKVGTLERFLHFSSSFIDCLPQHASSRYNVVRTEFIYQQHRVQCFQMCVRLLACSLCVCLSTFTSPYLISERSR